MEGEIWGVLSTFADFLGLVCCLGALVCRLWAFPPDFKNSDPVAARLLLSPIWLLFGGGIVLLAISSIAQFILRVSAMTGRPITEISPVLPTILLQTHYGRGWMLRAIMVPLLFAGWALARKGHYARTTTTISASHAGSTAIWLCCTMGGSLSAATQ